MPKTISNTTQTLTELADLMYDIDSGLNKLMDRLETGEAEGENAARFAAVTTATNLTRKALNALTEAEMESEKVDNK